MRWERLNPHNHNLLFSLTKNVETFYTNIFIIEIYLFCKIPEMWRLFLFAGGGKLSDMIRILTCYRRIFIVTTTITDISIFFLCLLWFLLWYLSQMKISKSKICNFESFVSLTHQISNRKNCILRNIFVYSDTFQFCKYQKYIKF